jgi:hypothetical protein
VTDDDLKRVLRGLEKARELAKSYRFEMTDEYRALIARVEGMPRNEPGADKSRVWPGMRAFVDSFKLVTRVRRS